MAPKKVILFTCNWNAYSGLESAGAQRLTYPPGVYPFRTTCLGQVNTGMILKAFEQGADGVLLLGCPAEKCQYEFGNRRVESVFSEARDLIQVLGYSPTQIGLDWVSAGQGVELVTKVRNFMAGLNGRQNKK